MIFPPPEWKMIQNRELPQVLRFVSSCPRGTAYLPHEALFIAAPCTYPPSLPKLTFPFQFPLFSTSIFVAHNMVQTKASNKLAGCQTEPTSRGRGGGEKMPNKRSPNYMKPTRSSDAQVTTIYSPTSLDKHSESLNHSKFSSSSPLKDFKNKPTRATCSSTLKNSKFPKDLELQPGGTDAEGTSALRVCPYNHCSLNGHWHEPLPPLKSFISAKRRLLITHKSFKLKGLPLFKVKASVEDEEEIVDDYLLEITAKVEEFQDLQLQRFGQRNSTNELYHTDEYYSDMHMKDDLYEKSELLVKEMDSMLSLLEYVGSDETIEAEEEVKEGREPICMTTLNVTSPNWEEDEVSITQNSNLTRHPDDFLGPMSMSLLEKQTIGTELSFEPPSVLCEMVETDAEQWLRLVEFETKENLKVESKEVVIVNDDSEELDLIIELIIEPTINHDAGNPSADQSDEKNQDRSCVSSSTKEHEESSDVEVSIQSYIKQDFLEINGDPQTEDRNYDTDDIYFLSSSESSEDNSINSATTNTKQPLAEIADVLRTRMRATCKKTGEEAEQMKEFNPRSPKFLEIEPEPKAETVDLRHQTTDEMKNREEWMIDYTLRRVISKLDPARKSKVSLLVKAFETVMLPHMH